MNIEYWLRKLACCSLLKTAKFLMSLYYVVFIITIILMLTSCGVVEVKHQDGHKPKIHINTGYADDIKVRLKHDGVVIYMYWEYTI